MKSLSLKGASDPIIVGFIGFGLERANIRNHLSPQKCAVCRGNVAAGEGREYFLPLRGQPYYAGYVDLPGGQEPLVRLLEGKIPHVAVDNIYFRVMFEEVYLTLEFFCLDKIIRIEELKIFS
jgi:hypothetical protein